MAGNMVYPPSATFLYEATGTAPILDAGHRTFRRPLLRLAPAGVRDGGRRWGGGSY